MEQMDHVEKLLEASTLRPPMPIADKAKNILFRSIKQKGSEIVQHDWHFQLVYIQRWMWKAKNEEVQNNTNSTNKSYCAQLFNNIIMNVLIQDKYRCDRVITVEISKYQPIWILSHRPADLLLAIKYSYLSIKDKYCAGHTLCIIIIKTI